MIIKKKKQPIELLKVIHQGDKVTGQCDRGSVQFVAGGPFALLPVNSFILCSFCHMPGGTKTPRELRYSVSYIIVYNPALMGSWFLHNQLTPVKDV